MSAPNGTYRPQADPKCKRCKGTGQYIDHQADYVRGTRTTVYGTCDCYTRSLNAMNERLLAIREIRNVQPRRQYKADPSDGTRARFGPDDENERGDALYHAAKDDGAFD